MAQSTHENLENPRTIDTKVELDRRLADLPYSTGRRNRVRGAVDFEAAAALILGVDGHVGVDTRSTVEVRPLSMLG